MAGKKIIIVGGGACGLMAAKELSVSDKVTILEASNRLGGRIHTVKDKGFTAAIEAGAEFVHGHVPLTLQLLDEAGIKYEETGGKMYRSENGLWQDRQGRVNGWDELTEKMAALEQDITLQDFLDKYFAGDEYKKLRDWAKRYAEGFDAATPSKVSVIALRDEWMQEDHEQYRIEGDGYGAMINYLEDECLKNGCEIILSSPVKQVVWATNNVVAYTANGMQFSGERLITTTAISVLQSNAISFTPNIAGHFDAANKIGYGGVVKVVLEFKTAFWNDYKKDMGFIVSDQFIPTWWTQAPDKRPVITGWLGGPKAEAMINEDDSYILEKSIQSLATIFGKSLSELKDDLVAGEAFNWPSNKFALGAYSYATPETPAALEILTTPIESTLFFAGEAIYTGPHPGTVEAALVSGKEVAAKAAQ